MIKNQITQNNDFCLSQTEATKWLKCNNISLHRICVVFSKLQITCTPIKYIFSYKYFVIHLDVSEKQVSVILHCKILLDTCMPISDCRLIRFFLIG